MKSNRVFGKEGDPFLFSMNKTLKKAYRQKSLIRKISKI